MQQQFIEIQPLDLPGRVARFKRKGAASYRSSAPAWKAGTS